MFVPFLYELRSRGVPVGLQESVALAQALVRGLHESSLDGFYYVARALCVHRESHLDAFDEAFLSHFRGVETRRSAIHDELRSWLEHARELDEVDVAALEQLSLERLLEMFEERLRQQRERHDGGSFWIGTGGTSPFGHSGAARSGIRVGGPGGNRSAVHVADARAYRPYRSDVVLDVRQIGVALRRLRTFAHWGRPELDVEGTIDATARNAGELEVVTRPPRRPNTRVLLLMDVGGSMEPYANLVSRLFSAVSKATHFKELRTYTFHNCVYGFLYDAGGKGGRVRVDQVLAECGPHFKLIVAGDAMMAPDELLSAGAAALFDPDERRVGLEWLMRLRRHFPCSVWLNPEPERYWSHETVSQIARVFEMFPLTLDGLTAAMRRLVRGPST